MYVCKLLAIKICSFVSLLINACLPMLQFHYKREDLLEVKQSRHTVSHEYRNLVWTPDYMYFGLQPLHFPSWSWTFSTFTFTPSTQFVLWSLSFFHNFWAAFSPSPIKRWANEMWSRIHSGTQNEVTWAENRSMLVGTRQLYFWTQTEQVQTNIFMQPRRCSNKLWRKWARAAYLFTDVRWVHIQEWCLNTWKTYVRAYQKSTRTTFSAQGRVVSDANFVLPISVG